MGTTRDQQRVVIIGGGAAGVAAALAAAGAGAQVTMVRLSPGTTALSSGAVDLAADPGEMPGDAWTDRASVAEHLREMLRQEPGHPLAIAGVDASLAGRVLEKLCEALDLLVFRPLEEPALVLPTDMGTFKSTTLCQAPSAGGHLPDLAGARLGVVGFEDHPLVDPGALAAGYVHAAASGGVQFDAVPVRVRALRLRGEQHMPPPALARHLDDPRALKRLVDALRAAVSRHDLTHLALPPVMGLERWRQTMDAVRDVAPAFEVLASNPPTVPGLRLQAAMNNALAGRDVKVTRASASGFHAKDGRVTAVDLEGEAVDADAFVLATGKFASGGLVHHRELMEALFRLPVWIGGRVAAASPRPGKYLAREVAGPHPLMRAGVQVDAQLRPLTDHQTPAWSNLHAAGSVVGGYDYITGRCGLGTAFITGHLAGAAAAGEGAA